MSSRETQIGFRIETRQAGWCEFVVALLGEVDLYTAPELKAELGRLADDGAKRIVIDLTSTTFIDSTTLGVLLGTVKRLRVTRGEVAVVCSDPNIRRIFEITLLDRVFPIFDSVDEALEEPAASRG